MIVVEVGRSGQKGHHEDLLTEGFGRGSWHVHGGVLIKAVTDAYLSIPRRTISDREKCTRRTKKIKRSGPQTVLTEEVEGDLKSWIDAM